MNQNDGRSHLGLIPAILAGLALRRSGLLPKRREAAAEAHGFEPGYEKTDVDVGKTAIAMGGLAGSALVAVMLMLWFLTSYSASQRRSQPALTPQQSARVNPPAPNLQTNPFADIDRLRAAESARLDGYGFTDGTRQRARIPIGRAMTLTVGRPLDP
ncbi:hypothetical protein [Methylobacterium soli]|uniref:Uncharacterized protein n=1 Tax=Methylobacterium soli TaxID=553447 RepID=A0A6L3T604_9HYPH|nr:hypothetical protein [Methylobacterium soli]KAB1078848.1 hypothetical protein F6X53_12600 [Methylobacterium soli]GJE42519.1 hypothetical protein AEGHOMDF_1691 [Methylobacterium soli]